MLKRKAYTVLLVGPKGRPWKLCIPCFAVYLLVLLLVIGAAAAAILGTTYARMLLKVSNYNHIRADGEALRLNYRSLESRVQHTNTQLHSLESLASEVAATYGFAGASRFTPQPVSFIIPARDGSGPEANYNASLAAFNRIEEIAGGRGLLLGGPGSGAEDIPSIWPVEGEVTSPFGERVDPLDGEEAFHPGIDISAPAGTPVRAAADGIVIESGREEAGYGIEILLDHGYGVDTRYGHLRRTFVVEGQWVKQGQVIGLVGMTGRTTGPHLHYEVLVHQTPVNPAKYLHG